MQYFQRKTQRAYQKQVHTEKKRPVQRNRSFRLAVIVPAMNEEDTLGGVLDEINRLEPDDLIVVVNGSTDQTAAIAQSKGARVVHYQYPLGNDVGRAIGLKEAQADIYLITDADIIIKAEQYLPFIKAIEQGEDASINSIDWITHYEKADTISAARYFLNEVQGRSDLRAENLLTIPHAISHSLKENMGVSAFANPMLATSVCLEKTKKVNSPYAIDVLKMNKPRKNHVARGTEILSLAMQRMQGDALEAIAYYVSEASQPVIETEISYSESDRNHCREQWWSGHEEKPVSFIVYFDQSYDPSMVTTIAQLQRNETIEVIPIVVEECSVLCWQFQQMKQPYIRLTNSDKLGHAYEMGRYLARGQFCLYHHGFIPLAVYQIAQFVDQATANPDAFIVNDQEDHFTTLEQMDSFFKGQQLVTMLNPSVNIHLSSVLLPPFLLPTSFACKVRSPENLQIDLFVDQVPVVKGAKVDVRAYLQNKQQDLLRDLLNGFNHLFLKTNRRGGFTDEGRRRELLPSLSFAACLKQVQVKKASVSYIHTGTTQPERT
ncbi:glycosyltransferase [Bacillus sp. Marseille-P3800]|uniref:glycosyltransferase n=1 Tax=Bacillus sp. Marseille-P3800 TaxID=2014782 RepID=UPI000C06D32E|nr:glycosyltransferase [Bacillus sp. Marseille-P3800]